MQAVHASRHALHSACIFSCFLHSASQSMHASMHAATAFFKCLLFDAASCATASHKGIMSLTVRMHAAIMVSPFCKVATQISRHAYAAARHFWVAATTS